MSSKNVVKAKSQGDSTIVLEQGEDSNEGKDSLKAKLKALKANLEDLDNLTESDLRDLKRLMKSTTKSIKVKTSTPVYLRATAVAEVIKENPNLTKDDIVIMANDRYMIKTGKESNIKRTRSVLIHVYAALKVFDLIS